MYSICKDLVIMLHLRGCVRSCLLIPDLASSIQTGQGTSLFSYSGLYLPKRPNILFLLTIQNLSWKSVFPSIGVAIVSVIVVNISIVTIIITIISIFQFESTKAWYLFLTISIIFYVVGAHTCKIVCKFINICNNSTIISNI